MLILIRKGTAKAIKKSATTDYSNLLAQYSPDWEKMKAIGNHASFKWNRPDHMEPRGKMRVGDIRSKLQLQLNECLGYLQQLQNGEGILYTTMMSVNGLGKIDVYHYIYFLVQHAKRHLAQMEKMEMEFNLGV